MAFAPFGARLAKREGPIRPMVDLSSEMAELWARLGFAEEGAGPGQVVQFVSAQAGEGVSTVAREFARFAAARARRGVWLIELDLLRAAQFNAIAVCPELYGELGDPVRASPNGSMFFSVDPKLQGLAGQAWPDERYLDAHPVGQSRWWVTRFRREVLREDQSVSIVRAPDYWNALRARMDCVVIDAPAAERSKAVLATAPFADANVLVVAGDRRDTRGPAAVRDALSAAGGHCAGLVFNRAPPPPPAFLTSLLP